MTLHTPTPWKVDDNPQNYGDTIEAGADEKTIASVEWFGNRPTPEAHANARLIAAAPALLAAAEAVEAKYGRRCRVREPRKCAWCRLRAAIAQAST